jgi:hypothetical protein
VLGPAFRRRHQGPTGGAVDGGGQGGTEITQTGHDLLGPAVRRACAAAWASTSSSVSPPTRRNPSDQSSSGANTVVSPRVRKDLADSGRGLLRSHAP